ncbi:MAG: type II toxin-antitoxin system PemK/MazF family toxin [Lentimonas sp.]
MKRGDIVIIAAPGDCQKLRPATVIQSDALSETGMQSVAVCLMTSSNHKAPLFRVTIHPTPENGLTKVTQIMVEKLFSLPGSKISNVIGRLTESELHELNQALTFITGLR